MNRSRQLDQAARLPEESAVRERAAWRSRLRLGVLVLLLAGVTLPPLTRAAPEASGSLLDVPNGASAPLDSGGYFTCAIRTYGRLACWGSSAYGELNTPDGTFTQVSAGGRSACAIRTEGTVACWGDDTYGEASPPFEIFAQVSVGGLYACGIRFDGAMRCWGDNAYGVAIPRAGTFTQISAGKLHACAIRTAGTLVCWGYDNLHQTDVYASQGGPVPDGTTFLQVSAGGYHTCGIETGGTVVCWGYNGFGQTSPPPGAFTQISSGDYHTCGIELNATLRCLGDDTWGQATPPGYTWITIGGGAAATCGVRTVGVVECFGNDVAGQTDPPAGLQVPRSTIDAGGRHTCGSAPPDGSLVCWGDSSQGQGPPPCCDYSYSQFSAGDHATCGIHSFYGIGCWNIRFPEAVPPKGVAFTEVSVGDRYACGLVVDGTVACWSAGSNVPPPPPGTFTQVSAGTEYGCGIRTDGTVACWGPPQLQPPSGTFTQISAGDSHTCGVETVGLLACWGEDSYGEASPPFGAFSQVSSGLNFSCALGTAGTIACWGRDDAGQTAAPVGTFTEVTAGGSHACALRTSGDWVCWGDNSYGQASAPDVFPPITSIDTGAYRPGTWSTAPVTIRLSATDVGTAGVASSDFRIDGGLTQTYTGQFVFSREGRHTLSYWSLDVKGNKEPAQQVQLWLDGTAPATSAGVAAKATGCASYFSPATVKLVSSDATSGIALIGYRLNGGPWQTAQPGTAPSKYVVRISAGAPGKNAVDYYATDVAGNVEATKSVSFTLGPSLAASPGTGSGATRVSLTGADFLSGEPASIHWGSRSGPVLATASAATTCDFTTGVTIPATPRGVYTLYAVGGTSGKSASASFSVTPALSLSRARGPVGSTVTLSGTGFDPNVPVAAQLDGPPGPTTLGSATTDASGNVTFGVVIPNATYGSHTLELIEASGSTSAPFFVQAALRANPHGGGHGTGATTTLSGTGYRPGTGPGSAVTITWDCSANGCNGPDITPGTITAAGDGTWTATVGIPASAAPGRTYTLRAQALDAVAYTKYAVTR